MKSYIKEIGPVSFPEFTAERIYMVPFRKSEGLPSHLRRWQPTVDQMLVGVESIHEIYLMIDQSKVEAGKAQRRPGPHIDGNWIVESGSHGPGPGHGPRHRPRPLSGRWETGPSWGNSGANFSPEAIILASSLSACRCYLGQYEGEIGLGGDCSGIDLSALPTLRLDAGKAYAGNVTMVHESLPVDRTCNRTLVRLNVPGWEP
jgi:hypothetical protein